MNFKSHFTVTGRYDRKAFWLNWLGLIGVSLVATWLPAVAAFVSPVPGAKAFLGLAAFFATFVIFYCQLCVITKRLHDMGHSGWLQAAPMALGVVLVMAGAAGARMMGDPTVAFWSWTASSLIGAAFLLWVGMTPGQAVSNRWGPPSGRAAQAEVFA